MHTQQTLAGYVKFFNVCVSEPDSAVLQFFFFFTKENFPTFIRNKELFVFFYNALSKKTEGGK